MNVHFSYKAAKTPDIEKEISHSVEKLRKRLQVYRPELVHLKGIVDQNSPREGTVVSLNLRLPSGQMAAQATASSPAAAVKSAFDDLLQQTTRHKDLLRNTHKWPRRRSAENTRPEKQVPFEETFAAVQPQTLTSEDIRSYVNANLGRLELFVERELSFREAADQIARGVITKEEVIDEAVVRALSDGGEKPDRLAVEAWLYRLAIRAMNELTARSQENIAAVPLEHSTHSANVQGSDEPELQFYQPDETLTAENVIADRGTPTPEDIAYTDEMITLVQFALEGVSPVDREAFVLYAIEGFTIDEIVAITDRKPDQVQHSISDAREHLRRAPGISDRFREKLLQATK